MARLTVVKVKNVRQPGRYGDGQGLYLNVAPGGSQVLGATHRCRRQAS